MQPQHFGLPAVAVPHLNAFDTAERYPEAYGDPCAKDPSDLEGAIKGVMGELDRAKEFAQRLEARLAFVLRPTAPTLATPPDPPRTPRAPLLELLREIGERLAALNADQERLLQRLAL